MLRLDENKVEIIFPYRDCQRSFTPGSSKKSQVWLQISLKISRNIKCKRQIQKWNTNSREDIEIEILAHVIIDS